MKRKAGLTADQFAALVLSEGDGAKDRGEAARHFFRGVASKTAARFFGHAHEQAAGIVARRGQAAREVSEGAAGFFDSGMTAAYREDDQDRRLIEAQRRDVALGKLFHSGGKAK